MLETIASIAGVAMALAIFPQAYKIFKDKGSRDVSQLTFWILSIGSLIWVVYGLDIHNRPIIASYGVRLVAAILVLGLILYYGFRKR